MPTALLMTSFDTRKEEALLLKRLIEKEGCNVLTLDVSSGICRERVADYTCDDIPPEINLGFEAFSSTRDTYLTMEYVIQGGLGIAKKLFSEGKIDGLAGIGGTSNTTIISLIMREFPFGFPKLIMTSSAAIPAYSSKFFADADIAIFHSCVEINTLNVFVQDVLVRFSGMVAGALRAKRADIASQRPAVAVSEFKFSEKCAVKVREILDDRGFQAVPFSATGPGERIMETMVEEGHFKGVIDIVPAGLSEALLGGNRASGLDRLDKELASGVPVILTPSGFEMLSCGPLERREADPYWKRKRIAERKLFVPDKYRVQARTTKKEMATIARAFGDKLNRATGTVAVFIPLQGFSSLSKEGGPLYEPEADAVFLRILEDTCKGGNVHIVPMNCSLDDTLFAEAIVEYFLKVMEA